MEVKLGIYLLTLHSLSDPSQRDTIRQNLLAYCRLDTLAMVRLWEKLRSTVEG